jgi:hypothetical protein
MRARDQFHLGIVAEDTSATMAALTALFGYEWGPEVGSVTEVALPAGVTTLDLRCVFSVTVPRLEIVRAIPGTMWEPASGGGIHHVGFFSDDVAADAAELAGQGYVTEATRTGPDGRPFFAFQRSAKGFRVELVSRAAQAGLERCWTVPARVPANGTAT